MQKLEMLFFYIGDTHCNDADINLYFCKHFWVIPNHLK